MNTPDAPLVSVIVPCYNYGHFLAYTVESILKGELYDWECIIVDDGSSDDTAAIAQKLAAKGAA